VHRSAGVASRLCLGTCSPMLSLLLLACCSLSATETSRISGKVLDPKGATVAAAKLTLTNAAGATVQQTNSDAQGNFILDGVDPGQYQLTVEATSFLTAVSNVSVAAGQPTNLDLQFHQIASSIQAVTVVASEPSSLTPDPAQSIIIHDQVLDANPGRFGAPISIPGLPIETASGGIKAPQYFAPGVAGDHGEPIGQFFQIGNFCIPTICPLTPTATATPTPIL